MALLPRDVLDDDGAPSSAPPSASLPLVLLVFGILGMTNEYRHGTITYTYLDTPRRWHGDRREARRATRSSAPVMALTGAARGASSSLVVGARPRRRRHHATGGAAPATYSAGNMLFIAAVGLMTAFGVGLGALLRAQVPTVAGVLVWALVIESHHRRREAGVGSCLPFTSFQQLNFGAAPAPRRPRASTLGLSRPEAFLVSLAYIALVSVAAVFISMRRDVT